MNEFKIKSQIQSYKVLLLLATACVVFSALPLLFAGTWLEILLALAAAAFACLCLVDRTKRHSLSIVLSLLLLVVFPIVNLPSIAYAVGIVAAGGVLWLCYARGLSKGEAALYLTLIFFSAVMAYSYLAIARELQSFALPDVRAYIKAAFDELREAEMKDMLQLAADAQISSDSLVTYVDQKYLILSNLLPAMFAIVGFTYAGICLKVFGVITKSVLENPRPRREWRFLTSTVFAYFYIAIFFVALVSLESGSTVSVAALNLYSVFLVVFGYLGVRHALLFTSRTRNPGLNRALVFLLLLFGNVITLQILSLSGVLFTIINNKYPPADAPRDTDAPQQ